MKNITALAVLVIIGFCAGPAAALENYALSVSPRFGMFYGAADEIVYPSLPEYPAKGGGDYLSLLQWNIKPVFYYGLDLDFARKRPLDGAGFFAVLSLKNAIPGYSGVMEDSDWRSKADNARTDYSVHDNFTEEIFRLDFTAGVSIPLRPFVVVKPYLAFSYTRFGFSGRDGYGLYAREISDGKYFPITDKPRLVEYSGKVISYTQQWFIVSPGLSVTFDFLRYFRFEAAFGISPAILCVDLDVHLGRYLVFNDYLAGGLALEPRACLSFLANEWLSLSLEASYRYIAKTRGLTYQRSMAQNGTSSDTEDYFFQLGEAGAGLSLVDAGILAKIRF